jgi:predicted secreted protein
MARHAIAHDVPPTYDRINFQVSATQEVENDTLVAIMYSERSGQQPAALANDVNETIGWAVDLAKKAGAVKVQTLNYRQEPLYKNQKVTGWRVRQSIRLESADSAALSTLIGELQARLSVASLQYTLSPEVRADVEDTLISEAIERFERRGKLISEQLGRPDYRIVNVNIITSGPTPMPVRMRAAAAMAESSRVAPPTVEPGVQSVTVQISGTIELEVR